MSTRRRGQRFLERPAERPAPPLAWPVVHVEPVYPRGLLDRFPVVLRHAPRPKRTSLRESFERGQKPAHCRIVLRDTQAFFVHGPDRAPRPSVALFGKDARAASRLHSHRAQKRRTHSRAALRLPIQNASGKDAARRSRAWIMAHHHASAARSLGRARYRRRRVVPYERNYSTAGLATRTTAFDGE
jgi:hypothetical protein